MSRKNCTILTLYFLYLCYSSSTQTNNWNNFAIVKIPVADLFINKNNKAFEKKASYEKTSLGCLRAHQLLFNEIVEIIYIENGWAFIKCDSLIYGFSAKNHHPLNKYWVATDALLVLKDMDPEINLVTFPITNESETITKKIIMLITPWDKYSVGTKFVVSQKESTEKQYAIFCYQPDKKSVALVYVPKNKCTSGEKLSKKAARERFITLLLDCIQKVNEKNKVIPYVWGGCSFCTGYCDSFFLKDNGWVRSQSYLPYMGFDCSGLVYRYAQLSGLSWPWRTTRVMVESLSQLPCNEMPEIGDLIWIPGHIMIIANVENNEIIEACGYSSGYGKVHKISVADRFHGINNFSELQQKILQQNFPALISKNNSHTKVSTMKILKLC